MGFGYSSYLGRFSGARLALEEHGMLNGIAAIFCRLMTPAFDYCSMLIKNVVSMPIIITRSAIFKVINVVVRFVSILMVYPQAIWLRPHECLKNQLMNKKHLGFFRCLILNADALIATKIDVVVQHLFFFTEYLTIFVNGKFVTEFINYNHVPYSNR